MMKTLKIIDEEFCVCQVADYEKVDLESVCLSTFP